MPESGLNLSLFHLSLQTKLRDAEVQDHNYNWILPMIIFAACKEG